MIFMVTFAQTSETFTPTIPRAAPHRACLSVAITCNESSKTSTLHEDAQPEFAWLVTCSRDPIESDEKYAYLYCLSSPISFLDFSGEAPTAIVKPKKVGPVRHGKDVCLIVMAGSTTSPVNYPSGVKPDYIDFDPYEIVNIIIRKKCCKVLLFGHQGETNGGISSQPTTDPPGGTTPTPEFVPHPLPHWWVPVLPNEDLEKQIGIAFKNNKCKECSIYNYACAAFEPSDEKEFNDNRQRIANNTGCDLYGLYGEKFVSSYPFGYFHSTDCRRWGKYHKEVVGTCKAPVLYKWSPQNAR